MIPGPLPVRPSLPWLRPAHVRWLLSRPVQYAVATVIVAATVAVAFTDRPLPGYRSVLWSRHGSLVLLGQFLTGWTLLLIHEMAHLTTARAAGVPGRIQLGTRLQFLVAQTDVSGIWAAPRRHRITVYAAGMACDAMIAATAFLISPATGPDGIAHQVTAVVVEVAPPFELDRHARILVSRFGTSD